MVKIVNIFKAAGLWVGTIFLLYGNKPVTTSAALGYTGYGALARSRSEGHGGERELSYLGVERETATQFPIGGFKQGGGAVVRSKSLSALRTEFPTGGFGK